MPNATVWIDPEGLYPKVEAGEVRAVSQTVLNQAEICLRRAAYYLDPDIPKGTSESALAGIGYHAGLERYYSWRKAVEDEFAGEIPRGAAFDRWPAPIRPVLDEAYTAAQEAIVEEVNRLGGFVWETSLEDVVFDAVRKLYHYFSGGHFWSAEFRIEGVEVGFTIPAKQPGWVDKGVIDLVVRNRKTGQLFLDDHKTTKKPWKKAKETIRNTLQSPFYVDAWERAVGERPDGFSFSIMASWNRFERRFVYIGDEEIAYLDRKKATVLPLLEMVPDVELPGNTQHFLCSERWCDFWNICPFGKSPSDGVVSEALPGEGSVATSKEESR